MITISTGKASDAGSSIDSRSDDSQSLKREASPLSERLGVAAGVPHSPANGPPYTAEPSYESWQAALKDTIRDAAELCHAVGLSAADAQRAERAAAQFGVFAPRSYVARMRPGDARDPLLRQVLPLEAELDSQQGFTSDPVGDLAAQLAPSLLHKYYGRALIVTTGACAVHCRYCFRRHFPYIHQGVGDEPWGTAVDEISQDQTLTEVILSGGDPLVLVDDVLARLAKRLARIEHVRRLRVHTRLPIVIPQRVTDELLTWLRGTRLTPIMVIHANHAAELTGQAAAAISRIVDAGIPVLNQAVLLRGVNDTSQALIELSERLIDLRVMPYYLHQLDRVAGAAHFEVPVDHGVRLVEEMRRRLPGYAVPRYVREEPGAPSKTSIEIA